MIIKYVDLISNPYKICNKIFKFLDLNFLSEVKDYIHLSTSTHKPGRTQHLKRKNMIMLGRIHFQVKYTLKLLMS